MDRGLESVSDILKRSFRHWQVHSPKQKNISFLPTIMTRLSPFFPVSKRQMKNDAITKPINIENRWGKIKVKNRKLTIYDESVLLSLLMLVKKYDSNTFQTTLYELCKLMNVQPTTDAYNAIMKSLLRMSKAHITMERRNNAQAEMEGSIINSITKNEGSKKITLELNSYFLSSFRDRFITGMDIRLRSGLRGDIAKALYRFYEGQRSEYFTINVLKLSRAINTSCNGELLCLRRKLRKAMHKLEAGGYLRRFLLPRGGNVVAVFKSKYRFLRDGYGHEIV